MTTPMGGSLPGDDGVGSKIPVLNLYLSILEAMVHSVDSKNLAASAVAVTLTGTEARQFVHVFSNAGAAIDIKYPKATTATMFLVKNSSGFTLTIKTDQGGSTGVAILNGKARLVWVNGNNVETAAPEFDPATGVPSMASLQATPSNPATTTSLSGVMMGLAGSITPSVTGRIMIVISGDTDNASNGDGTFVQIRTGTGSAPANGAAATGTARGNSPVLINPSASTVRVPVTVNAVVTGLTLGTAVWIDVTLTSVSGGVARIRNLSISAIEF